MTPIRSILAAAVLLATLAACGGGGGATSTPAAPTPPSITLASAANRVLSGGKPVALTATLSSSDTVTWQLAAGAPGSLSATSGATVNYVPPASVAAMTQVDISASAGGASKTIKLTLYPDPGAPGLSLVAGSLGGPGNADGAGTAARFFNIAHAATDSQGNLYVTESGYRYAIRKVTTAGVVSTLVEGTTRQVDGSAGQAQAAYPQLIASGNNGALLFTDVSDGKISLRQLAPDGGITTLVQDPLLGDARMLVAGPGNTAYVVRNRSIVLAGPGAATVLAGDENDYSSLPVDGPGQTARFAGIDAAAGDRDGNLLVLHGNRLSKVTPAGVTSTVLPASATSSGQEVLSSLALDANGIPLVLVRNTTTKSYAVRRLGAGPAETLFQGQFLDVPEVLDQAYPLHLRVANGKILLVRRTDIRQLQDKQLHPFAGLAYDAVTNVDGPGTSARFTNPYALAADGAGNIYVADYPEPFNAIQRPSGLYLRKIAPDNTVSTVLVRKTFGIPGKILADTAGNVHISETLPLQGRIQPLGGAVYKMTPDGALSLLAGQPAATGSSNQQVDGAGAAARFIMPELAGLDAAGNVYVRESVGATNNVRKITPDGTVTTIAALPAEIGVAPDGFKYTVEGSAIYRITASGKEVVAGIPGQYGTVTGALPGRLGFQPEVTPTGPYSFAVISGNAILKLVLPH